MSTETVDLSKLSAKELKAELQRREAEELAAVKKVRKEYHDDNEAFIQHTVAKFNHFHNELKALKDYTIREANNLYRRMFELEDKEPKEVKTFSRINKAQTMKITVDMQERFAFTDEAEVHLDAIQQIFKEKFETRNKGFYQIFEEIMMRNSKGEFDPKLLAKARRKVRELGDEQLIKEFDKLDECQTVNGTSLYCRVYIKGEKNKWKDVSLNFSSL